MLLVAAKAHRQQKFTLCWMAGAVRVYDVHPRQYQRSQGRQSLHYGHAALKTTDRRQGI